MRDEKDQRSIAFGSKMYVARPAVSDTQSHGPFHDYVYWYTANKALVDAGAQVINSSWGSFVQTLNRTRFDGLGNDLGADRQPRQRLSAAWQGQRQRHGNGDYHSQQYLKDLEYRYFFFKKSYSEAAFNTIELSQAFILWKPSGMRSRTTVRST